MNRSRSTAAYSDTPAQPNSSFLRRMWRRTKFVAGGPIASIGTDQISQGAKFIQKLGDVIRAGPAGDARLQREPDGAIDMVATALLYGITVDALCRRMQDGQCQTARAAYAAFGLGTVMLLVWIYEALHMTMAAGRIIAAVEFVPLCLLFFLLAFKNAWMNWQLRTQQLGSAAAYLRTNAPFLPR
jgi:hypothetical protein